MKGRAVVIVSVVVLGFALLPTLAQDTPKPPADQIDEKVLDELDEVRVREEVLTLKQQAVRAQLQQAVQRAGQFQFFVGGQVPVEQREQQLKSLEASKIRLTEIEDEYLELTKDLRRASRKRAELERRYPVQEKVEVAKPRAVQTSVDFIEANGTFINPGHVAYMQTQGGGDSKAWVHFLGEDKPLTLAGPQARSVIEAMKRRGR